MARPGAEQPAGSRYPGRENALGFEYLQDRDLAAMICICRHQRLALETEFPLYLKRGLPLYISPQRFVQQQWWFDLEEVDAWVSSTNLEYEPGMFKEGSYVALHLGPIWSSVDDRQLLMHWGMHCSVMYGPSMDCYERSSMQGAINNCIEEWKELRLNPNGRIDKFFKFK